LAESFLRKEIHRFATASEYNSAGTCRRVDPWDYAAVLAALGTDTRKIAFRIPLSSDCGDPNETPRSAQRREGG
jgi:glutamine synthetase